MSLRRLAGGLAGSIAAVAALSPWSLVHSQRGSHLVVIGAAALFVVAAVVLWWRWVLVESVRERPPSLADDSGALPKRPRPVDLDVEAVPPVAVPAVGIVAMERSPLQWVLDVAAEQELGRVAESARLHRPEGMVPLAVLDRTPSIEDLRVLARLDRRVRHAPAHEGSLTPLRSGEVVGGQRHADLDADAACLRIVDRLGQLHVLHGLVAIEPGTGLDLILQHRLLPWLEPVRCVVVGMRREDVAPFARSSVLVVADLRRAQAVFDQAESTANGFPVLVVVANSARVSFGELRALGAPGRVVVAEATGSPDVSCAAIDRGRWHATVDRLRAYAPTPLLPGQLPPPPRLGQPWVRLCGVEPWLKGARASREAAQLVAALVLNGGRATLDELVDALERPKQVVRSLVREVPTCVDDGRDSFRLRPGVGSDLGFVHRVDEASRIVDIVSRPPLVAYEQRWFRARAPVLEAVLVDSLLATAEALERVDAREEAKVIVRLVRRTFGPLERLTGDRVPTSEAIGTHDGQHTNVTRTSSTPRAALVRHGARGSS